MNAAVEITGFTQTEAKTMSKNELAAARRWNRIVFGQFQQDYFVLNTGGAVTQAVADIKTIYVDGDRSISGYCWKSNLPQPAASKIF